MVAAGIRLRGVSKRYALGETTIEALRPLDLDIEQSEFIAITGPSGSGKSTLANVVGGLDMPDTGTVTVGGIELNGASDVELSHYRSKMMGFVFQSFKLQSDSSVLENFVLPLIIAKVSREDRFPLAIESVRAVVGPRTTRRWRSVWSRRDGSLPSQPLSRCSASTTPGTGCPRRTSGAPSAGMSCWTCGRAIGPSVRCLPASACSQSSSAHSSW